MTAPTDPHAWPSLRPAGVLGEVVEERARQDAKWGEQNHPDVGQARAQTPDGVAEYHEVPNANRAKWLTDTRARNGVVSFADIAVEELCEAIEAAALGDEDAVRTEVIQLAAVCVQWAQAIDRRERAAALTSPTPEATPCWCIACEHLTVRARTEAGDPLAMFARRFIVCPDCGNKRCPKATHHDLACTGSNEPGQPGSAYIQAAAPPASAQEVRDRIAALADTAQPAPGGQP